MNHELEIWAKYAYQLAVKAGDAILHYYSHPEKLLLQHKDDRSPLTNADQASHQIIQQGLMEFALPILSEEGDQPPFVERQRWLRYWCVDPLDGTREFLDKNGEFTVNIALIEHHHPIIGVVYVPWQKKGYLAWRGGGAYESREDGSFARIATSPVSTPLRLLVSRHCKEESLVPWSPYLGETTVIHQGSALKFCTLARGEADLILRLSYTAEWDNAAGHCLLEEAGGALFSLNFEPLTYNRSGVLKQNNFIAVGDKKHNWRKCLPCG